MMCPATRAGPLTDRQVLDLWVLVPALAAGLAAGEPLVNVIDVAIVLLRLMLQPTMKFTKTKVHRRLAKVQAPGLGLHVNVLQDDDVVLSHEVQGELHQEISPLVRHMFGEPGMAEASLFPVGAASFNLLFLSVSVDELLSSSNHLLPTHLPLEPGQFPFVFPVQPNVLDYRIVRTVAGNDEILVAHVKTHNAWIAGPGAASEHWLVRLPGVDGDGDEVVVRLGPGDVDGFDISVELPMQLYLDETELRKFYVLLLFVEVDCVVVVSCVSVPADTFLLERREADLPALALTILGLEKVFQGRLEGHPALLECDGVAIPEVGILLHVFEVGVVWHLPHWFSRLLGELVLILPPLKEEVVHFTGAAEELGKFLFLLSIWVDSVLVCVDAHRKIVFIIYNKYSKRYNIFNGLKVLTFFNFCISENSCTFANRNYKK